MIHHSAASGYQRNSDTYASIRPSYHPNLIQRFIENFPEGTVVDLGAGTGIFTSQLVEAGYSPIAIEPVAEMRSKLANRLPSVDVRNGTAEDTGLEADSVGAVVAAQAFHWFNYQAALTEIKRILSPQGLLVCVWNVRDESVGWVRDYENTLNQHAGNTPRHRTLAWRHAITNDASFELVDEWVVSNPKPTSRDGVVKRALSTSFIATLDTEQQQVVLEKIGQIVSPLEEVFDFPYNSEMQVWRKRA